MPYKIRWTETGVEVQFSGIFDFETNKNANCEIYEDPRTDSINYAIWDASGVWSALATKAEFSIFAMQDKAGSLRLPSLKLAMLAKDTEILNLFEYYANYCNAQIPGWNVMVFDSMDKVRSWISS